MKTGIELIAEERQQQIKKGRTLEHDDQHKDGTLVVIAAALACDGTDAWVEDPEGRGTEGDPWGLIKKYGYRNGGDEIHILAVAGALIAAEIDRMQRCQGQSA